jgi:hypothetical protein
MTARNRMTPRKFEKCAKNRTRQCQNSHVGANCLARARVLSPNTRFRELVTKLRDSYFSRAKSRSTPGQKAPGRDKSRRGVGGPFRKSSGSQELRGHKPARVLAQLYALRSIRLGWFRRPTPTKNQLAYRRAQRCAFPMFSSTRLPTTCNPTRHRSLAHVPDRAPSPVQLSVSENNAVQRRQAICKFSINTEFIARGRCLSAERRLS